MGIYLVIPLIEILFLLALLALLFIWGRRHVARRPFSLFLGFMALWGVFIFLMRQSTDLSQALFWERFVLISILSASVTHFWFMVSLTGTRLPRPVSLFVLGITFFMVGVIPTDLVVTGMQLMWYGKAPVIGPLFPLYVMCVYVPIIMTLIFVIKHCRQSKISDERTRDHYIIVGCIVMLIGGTSDYLPSIGLPVYPLGIVGGILFSILTTIAMLRYGLLEMKVVLRKGAAYSLTSILIFGIFGCIILLLTNTFRNFINPLSLTITITVVFLVAAVLQPLFLRVQRMVDRWFFRQRYDYLQAVRRFARETEGMEMDRLSAILAHTVANGMQSSGVYLLLPSATTGDFVTRAFSGSRKQEDISFSASGPLAIMLGYQGQVIDRNDLNIIPSLRSVSAGERKVLQDNNIEILIPLIAEGRLTGMLLLAEKVSQEPYSNEDRRLLREVSGDIAARLEGALRYESIKIEHSALQKTMEGVIYAVSAVVESRDPYTAGHQRRVAELARAIAKEMGLSSWHQQGMQIIGLLHDVGKIAVPAEILSKPGKINHYEFDIIKSHSRIGYEILEKIDFPWPVSKAILQHHERLNGTGYPAGNSGSEIIMEARILGVADVVEAMSSHRPYRPALGLDLALKEITAQKGTLYDPDVVDACERLLRNQHVAFEQLMSAAEDTLTRGILSKS